MLFKAYPKGTCVYFNLFFILILIREGATTITFSNRQLKKNIYYSYNDTIDCHLRIR